MMNPTATNRQPRTARQRETDSQKIERAIWYLASEHETQPTLEEVAGHVGLSKYHFHRLFMSGVGTTPKRFLQFLTLSSAKELLAESRSVLDTAMDVGLSGPGRLHDLLVVHEGVTPGEFKRGGEGVTIRYGWHGSPFGECLLGITQRGICGLMFTAALGDAPGAGDESWEARRAASLAQLTGRWPGATLVEDGLATAPTVEAIFGFGPQPLSLSLEGTNFQMAVWRALLEIPPGTVVSYQDIAQRIGHPRAVRAVGTAVGANPVAYLIPCHRVVRKAGGFGGYRWGVARKRVMLSWEAARAEAGQHASDAG